MRAIDLSFALEYVCMYVCIAASFHVLLASSAMEHEVKSNVQYCCRAPAEEEEKGVSCNRA